MTTPSITGTPIRIGDVVHHIPSNEHWVVAKVLDNGDIYCMGWPLTLGKAEDIRLVARCTDEEHQRLLRALTRTNPTDPRHVEDITSPTAGHPKPTPRLPPPPRGVALYEHQVRHLRETLMDTYGDDIIQRLAAAEETP
jgi:hypothetical protein